MFNTDFLLAIFVEPIYLLQEDELAHLIMGQFYNQQDTCPEKYYIYTCMCHFSMYCCHGRVKRVSYKILLP
jgi:hypothetical protein